VILLATAGVNIFNPQTPLQQPVYRPALVFYTTQCELALGLWLLLGYTRISAWVLSLLIFGTFLILSLWAVMNGQNDCGCFGAVKVNPLWTLCLNGTVLAVLMTCKPKLAEQKWNLLAGVTVAGLVGLGALVARSDTGTYVLARWTGEPVVMHPPIVDAGTGVADEQKTLAVSLTNVSSESVRIIGGSVSCSCTTTAGLPVNLAPGETIALNIQLTFKGAPGEFTHRFEFLTDTNKQPKVRGAIQGRIVAAP